MKLLIPLLQHQRQSQSTAIRAKSTAARLYEGICVVECWWWATQYDVYYFVWLVLWSCIKRLEKQQIYVIEKTLPTVRETYTDSQPFIQTWHYIFMYVCTMFWIFHIFKKIKITFHTQNLNYYHFFFEIFNLIYSAYIHYTQTQT